MAAKSKIADLLNDLDAAYDVAEAKRDALAAVSATAANEITEKQKALDTLKAEHQSKVQAASAEVQVAQAELEKISAAVNERLGQTNSRVSVR